MFFGKCSSFWQTPACAGLVSAGFILAAVNQPGTSPETLGITVCVCVSYMIQDIIEL